MKKLESVVAKHRDEPYRFGERAMMKVKQHRTADCVVGGFRHDRAGPQVASLLLGLYDDAGLLNHVGFAPAMTAAWKRQGIWIVMAVHKEMDMADDKTARGPQDASRIAMGEDYEIAYWTKKFGVTREELQRAVDAVGNGAAAVEQRLKR